MIHVYYGEGKGKTTAAAGLALRMLGNGSRVVFLQFLKARFSGEVTALAGLPGVTVLRNETDFGFYKNMTPQQKEQVTALHNQNLQRAEAIVQEGACELMVLDELFSAWEYGLLDREIVWRILLMAKERKLELVMTGRKPDPVFVGKADYITQMKKERHPFDRGVPARKGIEY